MPEMPAQTPYLYLRTICVKAGDPFLAASSGENRSVCYPVVLVKVNGVKCRALLDTGAGSYYDSSALIDELNIKPKKVERRCIEMMMGQITKNIQTYQLHVESAETGFGIEVQVSKVDRDKLLVLDNPKYAEKIAKYSHLSGVEMIDKDQKDQLPVHMVIGASDYARIKTETPPKIGQPGEPVAEKTVWLDTDIGRD